MIKTFKSQIRETVNSALVEIVQQLKIEKPSKKTRKAIGRVAKALRSDIKSEAKQRVKSATMVSKKQKQKKMVSA
ncbi:MAG TPA: hypothetical protein VK666_14525 [Chryseolinea sp.]|nr:hypothetical protein [Chryseolinea sp.]